MNNIGVVCARLQPLHKGHIYLINEALSQCDKVILCVRSAREGKTERNPFNWSERYVMVNAVYRYEPKLDTLFLDDINDPERWSQHVYDKVTEKYGKQESSLTVFGGGEQELSFYNTCHFTTVLVDRTKTGLISGTELRRLVTTSDDKWKEYIPVENHELVEAVLTQMAEIEAFQKEFDRIFAMGSALRRRKD